MKMLLMIFLVASNYFPYYQEDTNKLSYTQLNGVFIERGDCISLEFVAYTIPGVNKEASVTVEVNSNGNIDIYEKEYYELQGEDILQLNINNYIDGVDVNVIVNNFFYPSEFFEYSFYIPQMNDGVYEDDEKRVYSNNPYFCSFNINECREHYLYFPYYKDEVYIDYESKNYLDYFRFYVDDFYDLNFKLRIEYEYNEYLYELSVYKKDGEHYFRLKKPLYYNSTNSILEEIKTNDNYRIKDLQFPVKSELRLTLLIRDTINYNLLLTIVPEMNLVGSCEEALFCFVIAK